MDVALPTELDVFGTSVPLVGVVAKGPSEHPRNCGASDTNRYGQDDDYDDDDDRWSEHKNILTRLSDRRQAATGPETEPR